ncbi:MAG TPA: type II secretion system protein [Candidatus Paceibacterota bacterium]|nr:type II secretion system protein [Verrucomicrobiota bacterium]HRY51650.1 type II secretion system protein [Candidatus Paceibacterota bacterium]HSA01026.1 type II secretion system protein [Candidatus Paceibacterota bacterium]
MSGEAEPSRGLAAAALPSIQRSAVHPRAIQPPCHSDRKSRVNSQPFRRPKDFRAFTLIELLVVIAVISILAGLLLPALARAKEKAKVIKVHAELYSVGLALEMYADDHEGQLPPVRVNCNSDLIEHWCQFPMELADQDYLPRGDRPGMAANMEDVFNAGHTYKYATPGPQILNDTPGGNFKLWAPEDFPIGASTNGKYYSSRTESPVRWVLWSLGPKPKGDKALDSRAPLAARSWYQRAGEGGVIARFATREGMQIKTP